MDELKQKLLRRKRKALRDSNESQHLSACTELASTYMEAGQFNIAIDEFHTIANIYKRQEKMLEYARANRGIGEAYLGLHNFEDAMKHQVIYLDTVRELKDKLEEQRALATIGHMYLTNYLEASEPNRNNLHAAQKFFKKSFIVCQDLSGVVSKVEISDMSARLLSNLGVVQDCLGNFDEATELIKKSIKLCQEEDLYEQLQRGHMSMASVLVKKGEIKMALEQYNLAAETAKKLHNKATLRANVLLNKSEVLCKLGDLQGAKRALKLAYKLKTPDMKERKMIEDNLGVVASMSYTEAKLLETDQTDYINRKVLYEKMGDGATELKLFAKALDYYKKMMDAALKANMPSSALSTCYYSLAETYRDNGQLREAVENYDKELDLELEQGSFKDSLNTLSKIADTKECDNLSILEVQAVYKSAVEICQKANNSHEEGRMTKRLILYLRRQNQQVEASKLEQHLNKLNYQSSDSEGESSEEQSGSVVGADIDLDAITDVTDDSDVEPSTATRGRRRTKNFQIRKNIKGETQLHTACIQGKINVVHQLLQLGHPVNIRDHSGWLPLHEACNRGRLEIVKLLLEKGAAIDDRGGTHCGGITPLHDAAINGHVEIVYLLLNKGSNAVARTDEGETVLQHLQRWHSNAQLDQEKELVYQTVVDQISQALEKVGHTNEGQNVEERPSSPIHREDMRRSAAVGLEDEDSQSPPRSLADDYRIVMGGLRHRENKTPQKTVPTTSKRSALVSADRMVDDWLEDDLGKSQKKRKTNSPVKSQTAKKTAISPAKRRISRQSNDSTRSSASPHSVSNSIDIEMIETDPYYYPSIPSTSRHNFDNDINQAVSPSPLNGQRNRPKQGKLTDFGHTRTLVEADSTSSPQIKRKSSDFSTKRPLSSTRSFENVQPTIDSTLSVDVRINAKLYRVPILLSEVNTNTFKWLADEAAARYARKEYMMPALELETQNGALLAEDDPISLLFPMGASQADEVRARVIKWSMPPLINRYKEACQDMNVDPQANICQILQEFSVSLDLSYRSLKGSSLAPLCKVITKQSNLLELNLSGNFLTNECVAFLGASLVTLENLYKLNLSCTGLTEEHVHILTNNISSDPTKSYKITDLDLSDNVIGDQCFKCVALLTHSFRLKILNLSGNRFTKDIFMHSQNKSLRLMLDDIEEIDLSDNSLSTEAIVKIVSWLQISTLRSFSVSRNSVDDRFLKEMLSLWMESDLSKLQTLKLSRCHVQDSDLFDLLRIASSLETLDLTYNKDLTSISLRRLLQSDFVTLDLFGCNNIFQYFTEFSKYIDEPSQERTKNKTIKLSIPETYCKETESLTNMWKQLYRNRAVVELSSQFLCLSLSK